MEDLKPNTGQCYNIGILDSGGSFSLRKAWKSGGLVYGFLDAKHYKQSFYNRLQREQQSFELDLEWFMPCLWKEDTIHLWPIHSSDVSFYTDVSITCLHCQQRPLESTMNYFLDNPYYVTHLMICQSQTLFKKTTLDAIRFWTLR